MNNATKKLKKKKNYRIAAIVYHIFIIYNYSDKNKIIYNAQCGHMLRTKLEKANEGGVAAGSGALDSPYLYDD